MNKKIIVLKLIKVQNLYKHLILNHLMNPDLFLTIHNHNHKRYTLIKMIFLLVHLQINQKNLTLLSNSLFLYKKYFEIKRQIFY